MCTIRSCSSHPGCRRTAALTTAMTWSNTPMAPAGISLVCLGWPGTVVWCRAITHLVFVMIRTLGSIKIRPVFALLLSKKIVCVASWGLAMRQRRRTSTYNIPWRSVVSLQPRITISFRKRSSKISRPSTQMGITTRRAIEECRGPRQIFSWSFIA